MDNLEKALEQLAMAMATGIKPYVEPVIEEEAVVAKAVPDPRGRYDWRAEASIPRLLAEGAAAKQKARAA